MGKRLNAHIEWLDSAGYSPYVWLRGDWHQPLHLLSKLLADELNKRRPSNSTDDVTFKIGFNTMLQLAEEMLGVPCLITEKDLMIHYPNIMLAMLVYLICVKHSVDFVDIKSLRSTVAPKLVFEARNAGDAQLPRCASCSEHVFIIERVVIESCVWHRHCFKCVQCTNMMRTGGFRKGKRGYECVTHAVRRILGVPEEKRSIRPQIAPPEVPSANSVTVELGSKKNASKSSVPPPISPKPKLGSSKQKPSLPPKPASLSVFKEQRTAAVIKDFKPAEPTSDNEIVSVESEHSGDSGIVIRAQNVLVDTDAEGYEIVSVLIHLSPHRPKRASLMFTSARIEPKFATESALLSVSTVAEKSTTIPLDRATCSDHNESGRQSISSWLLMEDSTDSSYIFTDSDEAFIGESRNPFADSDDDCKAPAAHTFSGILTPVSTLPGESNRPKCTPPPPPPISSSFPNKAIFAENNALGGTNEITKKLEKLDVDLERIMREGKQLEVEMLFLITQNPSDWLKMPRTEDFIEVMCKFLDVLRESTKLQFIWRETFLNEMHSETEYFLRQITSKNTQSGKRCIIFV
ncbi:unnamed protein product [Angiostrongylus costaricensis]|uniref:LIM zinc-binding domain-containing protein n=1 Tax=Angiostrongylus costaricensis TaxID=334426 RepID=A0A158PFJ0_ANGCS|nr:unnamed protein product [Angiostrongylus costaricensis]